MSVRFEMPSSPLSATHHSPDEPIAQPKKAGGFFRRVLRAGRGVVTGGRQIRGILMRLVNAQGAPAARCLTSPAEAMSTTRSLGLRHPRGQANSNPPERIGLGILRVQSDGQTSTPSAHLENARRNLRLMLLTAQSYQNRLESPILSETTEDADDQKSRFLALSARHFKRSRSRLDAVRERLRPNSSSAGEMNQIKEMMGAGRPISYVKHVSGSTDGSFWSITALDGSMWSMQRVSDEDSHSSQILANELHALRRVRGVDGLPLLEEVDSNPDTRFILTKWMGDYTLLSLMHNDESYDARFTLNQMARLLHAIHRMHQCGVVHRKVSAENIMVGGSEGNLTLFDFNSCVITNEGNMVDGGLHTPMDSRPSSRSPGRSQASHPQSLLQRLRRLGHIWHEMRTGSIPTDDGSGKYRVNEELLYTDEKLFIRRLLSNDDYYRFNSVEEMKDHAVFSDIDWRSFDC
ncbi:hypothetical protein NP233_g8708 [Leucocoprinus birnbaumii]|uniref:non-specific serine/threonine protein kinase n=1 Tax=Leucocoprinus birnbaumii TaxID=56174 RepID=A0AAD5VLT4_9AGAR|nr:hypothetical protein NP233_g8708 [Leucocoprinus birnbaumii]